MKGDYTASSVGRHAAAKLQLKDAGRTSADALLAAKQKRAGRQEDANALRINIYLRCFPYLCSFPRGLGRALEPV